MAAPNKTTRKKLGEVFSQQDPKLTQKQKDKWLTALRSGKYKQGKEQLVTDIYPDDGTYYYRDNADRVIGHEYCCLGVLREVSRIKAIRNVDMYESYLDFFSNSNDATEYTPPGYEEILAMLNDGFTGKHDPNEARWTRKHLYPFTGQNFEYIADFIEEFLPVKGKS